MNKQTRRKLLNKKNVVAVGEGQKWKNGINTGEDAILIFVKEKEPKNELNPTDLIPNKINNKKTDVVGKSGLFEAFANTKKIRPILGGYSVGHIYVTVGTLGGWFKDSSGEIVGLSNNHVLANENNAKKYNPITGRGHWSVQPGVYDSKLWRQNRIGQLKDFVKLSRYNNKQDSAICRLDDENIANLKIAGIGYMSGFNLNPKVGLQIQKVGRTTNKTSGKIISINTTINVRYGSKIKEFEDQIICNNRSAGGDSGSLLLDFNNNVVGLLYAGSSTMTCYNKISYVKNKYGLEIIKKINENITIDYKINNVSQKHNNDPTTVLQLAKLKASSSPVSVSIDYSASPI